MKKKEKPPKEKAKSPKKRSTFSGGCLILVWGIASITFALIIHQLFSTPAPYDWMVAKWSAGDMLTYASTVALGLLAVWQNQKFKEENDESQARLEKLTMQANEISIISKIIEYESAKYERVQKAIESFDHTLDFFPTVSGLAENKETQIERKLFLISESHKIRLVAYKLCNTIDDDMSLRDDHKNCIEDSIEEMTQAAEKVINAMQAELSSSNDHLVSKAMTEFESAFETYSRAIITYQMNLKIKYEQLIYGNMSLEEIRKMYGYTVRVSNEEVS